MICISVVGRLEVFILTEELFKGKQKLSFAIWELDFN